MRDTAPTEIPLKTARRTALTAAVLSAAVYIAAHALLKQPGLAPPLRTAAALLPVPFFLFFLFFEIRLIRRLDELEQRIQLDALAFAFPGIVVVLMTLGLLQVAGVALSPEDWSYRQVWLLALVFYVLGVVLARKRYQ
jgi:hypothetical protein